MVKVGEHDTFEKTLQQESAGKNKNVIQMTPKFNVNASKLSTHEKDSNSEMGFKPE